MCSINNNSSSRPFTVIVEGNIGSGKTKFVKYFEKFDNVCTLEEPIELWKNFNNHNLLELVYEDPKKWSFLFQSYVQVTMAEHHIKSTNCPIKIIERSIYSASYCFVEKMKQDGMMDIVSAAVLQSQLKLYKQLKKIDVDLIVYLRTSPEVAYERIKKRNRPEEKDVSLEYLKGLNKIHEDWLNAKRSFPVPAPVLILDANLDECDIFNEYLKYEPIILNNTTNNNMNCNSPVKVVN